MKKILLTTAALFICAIAPAQSKPCVSDSLLRTFHFESDTKWPFVYVNGKYITGFGVRDMDNIPYEKIEKITVKDDEYGNRAIFVTYPEAVVDSIHQSMKHLFIYDDPQVFFQGDNGSGDALLRWIKENQIIPEGFKGNVRVVVKFKINPDGTVSDAAILRPSKIEALNQDALRLVSIMPRFKVVYYNPRRLPIGYTLPIRYRAPDPEKAPEGTLHIR